MHPVIGWIAGLVFFAAAIAFGVYIWKRYRQDLAAAKLPEDLLKDDEPSSDENERIEE